MDFKHIILVALQVSVLATVFGFGLKATMDDLLYVVRRPGLLARSLLAVFVIMPLVVVTLVQLFAFRLPLEVALVALSLSPVPPILPQRELKAGGHVSFALGLLTVLSLVSLVAIPAWLKILEYVFERPMVAEAAAVAGAVVKSVLLPLAAGAVLRALAPAFAERLEKPVTKVAKVLLPLTALVLLIGATGTMWALVGNGTLLALAIFTLVGLGIGHVLGGPNPSDSAVLALSTACRHPAIAMSIAAASYPEERFGGVILLYLVVSGLVGAPYLKWQRRRVSEVFGEA
jgi:BASS family bile acid:Na+ symporter